MNKLSTSPKQCPHADCPGCSYDREKIPSVYTELKEFFRGKGNFPLITGELIHWRMRAKLAVRREKGKTRIGLFEKGTHKVIEIPRCISHHPSINFAVEIVKKALLSEKIEGYDDAGRGFLRYIQCVVSNLTGKVQLVLVCNISQDRRWGKKEEKFLSLILKNKLFHSIWINHQTQKTNRIFSDNWSLIQGDEFIWQMIAGHKYAFHPAAFSQAHLSLYGKLLKDLAKAVDKRAHILELYCGVGVIGLHLSKFAKKVVMVENNPFSEKSFHQSVKKLNPTAKKKIQYRLNDAASAVNEHFDHLIFDPPRKGVEKELLKKVLSWKSVQKIIYVSCNVNSFMKDAAILEKGGYKTTSGRAYLLFPGSNDIEILAVFEKKSG